MGGGRKAIRGWLNNPEESRLHRKADIRRDMELSKTACDTCPGPFSTDAWKGRIEGLGIALKVNPKEIRRQIKLAKTAAWKTNSPYSQDFWRGMIGGLEWSLEKPYPREDAGQTVAGSVE